MAARYWPLGVGRIVTSPFGDTAGRLRPHTGTDFGREGGSANMAVYAVQAGTVIHAGAASGYGGPDPAGWLVIDSSDAEGSGCLEYGHIVREVARGDRVRAGQRIGHINPNRATNAGVAPHLHLSDMPAGYDPRAKQDPMRRLRGALEPGTTAPPGGSTPMTGWTGNTTWLADVLRADGQIDVRELSGWRTRGHGVFKDVRGIMFHHTGGAASAESIRDGRPDLAGPLSQLHISRTGVVTVVCAGVAWHAGVGSLPWVPTNMGNWHLLGVECEWPYPGSGVTGPGNAHRCPWDPRQIKAMRNVAAAVCRKLGTGSDRVTTHKSYAGAAQGKWDPGYFDEDWFQDEVAKDLSGFQFPGEATATTTPPPVPIPQPPVNQYAGVLLYRGMSGSKVRALQTRLQRNYSKLAIDGDYGPHTEACVRDYQRLHPPLIADGVVGPATAASLKLEV